MSDSMFDEQKKIEFYAASVSAWYTTALEYDKSIFALAGGGIAILVTLLTTKAVSSYFVFGLFVTAIFSYLVCLGALLTIFRRNKDYILAMLEKPVPARDPVLQVLDLVAILAFATGTVLASGIGIVTALDSLADITAKRNAAMTTEQICPKTQLQAQGTSSSDTNRMEVRKSFNGAAGLQPDGAEPAAPPTTEPPSASAPAPAPSGQADSSQQELK